MYGPAKVMVTDNSKNNYKSIVISLIDKRDQHILLSSTTIFELETF